MNFNKIMFFILLTLWFFLLGCRPLEWVLTDINGWDLSACVDGFDTCYELFSDNQERILGGQSAIDLIFGNP